MPILEKDISDAVSAWGDGLLEISNAYENSGIEKATSVAGGVLDSLYGYNLGSVLFKHNIFVYFSIFIVIVSTYYLFKTAYGLRARAVGEHPKAAETLGISVIRTRFNHVIIGGMIAGFGGAWFTLGSVGRFDEGMTGGRGFIGLAAMIFGRWHPIGALFAALVFGFADSLQQKLAILRTPIPSEFLAMAPYLVTIIVVAGIVGNAKPPQAIGKAYVKEN